MNPKFQPPDMGAVLVSGVMADGKRHAIAVGDYIKYSNNFFGFVWDKISWNGADTVRFVGPDVAGNLGVRPSTMPDLGKGIPNGVKIWATYVSDINSLWPMSEKEVLDWMTPDLTPDWLMASMPAEPKLVIGKKDESRRVSGHMPGIDGERVSKDAWDAFKETL